MKPQCEKVERLASRQRESGCLSLAEEAFVEAHLAACEDCRTEAWAIGILAGDAVEDHVPRGGELENRRRQDAVLMMLDAQRRAETKAGVWRRSLAMAGGLAAAAACLMLYVSLRHPPSAAPGRNGEPSVSRAPVASTSKPETAPGAIASAADKEVVKTGEDTTTMTLAEGMQVLFGPNTEVAMVRERESVAIELREGMVLASLTPRADRPPFRVITRSGTVVVKGTIFSVDVDARDVTVTVLRGRVEVENSGLSPVYVGAGQQLTMGSHALKPIDKIEELELSTKARTLEVGAATAPEKRPPPKGEKDTSDKPALSAAAMLHEADAANRDRAWTMAIGRYKRLVKAHPENTESQIAHVSLGNIYLEKVGDAHQARRWFAQYRRRFPNGLLGQEALYGEIQSLKTLGAIGEEAALIERFLSRFPKAVQTAKLQKRLSALKALGDDSAN